MSVPDHKLSDEGKVIKAAGTELHNNPLMDVVWHPHGEEYFHPDVGEYWKPPCINVSADMGDMTVLHVLSSVMDNHGLKVHDHHGIQESRDDWARLVVDRDAH